MVLFFKKCIAPGIFLGLSLFGQTLDVTFRYIPDPSESFLKIFVPGTMPDGTAQDWGPNSGGIINPAAASKMELNIGNGSYEKKYPLNIGSTYEYKFHFHYNESGTSNKWITDPLNPVRNASNNNNAILNVTDPLVFQPAYHFDIDNKVMGISSGVFTNSTVDSISIIVGNDTIDGTSYLKSSNGVFYYPFETPRFFFDGLNVSAFIDSVEYKIFSSPAIEITTSPLPDGIETGPNFDGSTLTIAVLAPSQPLVQLSIAPESNTENDTLYTMNKDSENSDVWWIALDSLISGNYAYSFKLMNGHYISDPLSRMVKNNKTIVNVGAGGISTADDFEWTDGNYIIPSLDTLAIYELHVDDFAARGSGKGRFSHVIEKLDHFNDLGINAIELMPIMEFPGNHNWGYHNTHFSAVESSYGAPADFKELVDQAHSRGIAVILDIVWNHANGGNPLWQIQPNVTINPYFKSDSDLRPNEDDVHFGGVDMDHFTPETQAFVRQVHNIWVEEYHVDGFRFDFTRGIGWSESQPEFGILGWSTALKEDHPNIIQTVEHLPSDPYLVKVSDIDAGWHDSFHDRLKDEIFGSNDMSTVENQIIGLHEYSNSSTPYLTNTSAVKYMVSHDEQSLIQEMVLWKGHSLEKARARDILFATLLYTSPGIPMIWQGQEYGMQSGWTDVNGDGNWDGEKLSYRPMDWSLASTEPGQKHYWHYQNLARIYKVHPAIRNGYFSFIKSYEPQRSIVYGYNDPSQSIGLSIIANLSSSPQLLKDVSFSYSGTWKPILGGGVELNMATTILDSILVPAYTAFIYSNVEWETLGADENVALTPDVFKLDPAYPNPFNAQTNFSYEINAHGFVDLSIYNILGEKVSTLVQEEQKRGRHSVSWSAGNIPSGMYFYVLNQGKNSAAGKILLLK